ncbi:hypothetical protein [Marinobacter sp.]|uniref:hypothetical protein n=1 Tax=Marinobacter sp. TaxID=50741 RepID=UPI003A94DA73
MIKKMLCLPLVVFVLAITPVSAASLEDARLIDSPIEAYEAASVELMVDSSSRVFSVVTEGCELCPEPRLLPARGFKVQVGKREVGADGYRRVSGQAGTVLVDSDSGMALMVIYPVQQEGELQ